jgi:hypothetical protein
MVSIVRDPKEASFEAVPGNPAHPARERVSPAKMRVILFLIAFISFVSFALKSVEWRFSA